MVFGRPPKPGVDFFPGVLPGVPRTTFSGTLTSNTVYQNLNFGTVQVRGLQNVTFINCKFTSTNYSNATGFRCVNGFSNSTNATGFNIRFEDCTIEGANTGIAGPVTLIRCHLLNQGDDNTKPDQVTASNRWYAEDCWFERMGIQTDAAPHADAIQAQGGGYVTAIRCNFDHPYPDSPGWVAKMATIPSGGGEYRSNAIWQEDADDPNSNVLFEDCWVNGGNTTMNLRGLGGTNRVFRRLYVGLENRLWQEGREGVREALITGSNFTAVDWYWEDNNEPVSGIPTSPGNPGPTTIQAQSGLILPRPQFSNPATVAYFGSAPNDTELAVDLRLPSLGAQFNSTVVSTPSKSRRRLYFLYSSK